MVGKGDSTNKTLFGTVGVVHVAAVGAYLSWFLDKISMTNHATDKMNGIAHPASLQLL